MSSSGGQFGGGTGNPDYVRLQDGAATALATVVAALGDAAAPTNELEVAAFQAAYNGAAWDRRRTASAANLIAESSLGAALVAPPGFWAVQSAPAVSTQASAVRAAGGAGVRHVATARSFAAGSTTAPALTALLANLRDGASGAGTLLESLNAIITAAVGQNVAPNVASGLNAPGTAATAMTEEFSALLTNLLESVMVMGYDAS